MNNCRVVEIKTPKKYLLSGLYFGPAKAKNVFIFLHGLGGNVFSLIDLSASLVDSNTAVITFNNRGHDTISRVRRENKRVLRGYDAYTTGMAHEVFTDCLDDIDGAVNLALQSKPNNIFLVGHSTGCQKSIYYLAKRPKSLVSGAVLLAPMSDYADMYSQTDKKKYNQLVMLAKKMISQGRGGELMPANLWPVPLDAQRFISLFVPESVEEIFSYASGKHPDILRRSKKPLLVVLAGEDEYRDRPIAEIATWFEGLHENRITVKVIDKAIHNFHGYRLQVKKLIKDWSSGRLSK